MGQELSCCKVPTITSKLLRYTQKMVRSVHSSLSSRHQEQEMLFVLSTQPQLSSHCPQLSSHTLLRRLSQELCKTEEMVSSLLIASGKKCAGDKMAKNGAAK